LPLAHLFLLYAKGINIRYFTRDKYAKALCDFKELLMHKNATRVKILFLHAKAKKQEMCLTS
jgi:hypothetical protein